MNSESKESYNAILPEETRPDAGELKIEINELLWRRLPPETSLHRAEQYALQIFEIISEDWDLWEAAK